MAGIGNKKTTGNYPTRERLVTAVMLRHWRGFNQVEIAKVTGVSARTVVRIIKAFYEDKRHAAESSYDEVLKAEQKARRRNRAIRDAILIILVIIAAAIIHTVATTAHAPETVTVAAE